MKIRKQVRALYKKLVQEAVLVLQGHDNCKLFMDSANKCVLCALLRHRKIFAAIHLAREKNVHMEWFDSEKSLYDLLGEKMFFNKIEIELKEVANYPRKECPNCRRISTFFIPFKKLSRQQGSKQGECSNCEAMIDLNEIPSLPASKEKKYKFKEDQAPRIRLRNGRVPGISHNEAPKTLESIGEEILREAEAQDNSPFEERSPEVIAIARNLLSNGTVEVVGERVAYGGHFIDPADRIEVVFDSPGVVISAGGGGGIGATGGGTGGSGGNGAIRYSIAPRVFIEQVPNISLATNNISFITSTPSPSPFAQPYGFPPMPSLSEPEPISPPVNPEEIAVLREEHLMNEEDRLRHLTELLNDTNLPDWYSDEP